MPTQSSKKTQKKIQIEPSWTGPRAYGGAPTPNKRLVGWICHPEGRAGAGDFTENINWRIFRIIAEFVEGFEFLSHLNKEVSIFGSARTSSDDHFFQMAKKLGTLCAKSGFTVITGGGPGIMEAANCGAVEGNGESVGLNISLPREQRSNPYVRKSMGFHYFFTRKVMLSASAQAYVFFPGGFGTFNELFEVVELIQTGKTSSAVPVILVGKKFWQPLLNWIREVMFGEHQYINREDMNIMHLVDSAEEAFEIIKKTKERML